MSPPSTPSSRPLLAFAAVGAGALLTGLVIGSSFSRSTPVVTGGPAGAMPSASPASSPAGAASGLFAAGKSATLSSGALADLQKAGQGTSEFTRTRLGIMATSRLTLGEITSALAFADTLGQEERRMVTLGALARWSELDPRGAAEWARSQLKRRPDLSQLISTTVAEWATQDPLAAKNWIETIKSPDERSRAQGGYFRALGASDPAKAMLEVAALPPAEQENARANLFKSWASRNPQAALAEAQALGESQRNDVLRAMMPVWAQSNPQDAVAAALRLDKQYADQPGGSPKLAGDLLNTWARRDPAAALAQTLALPAEQRDAFAQNIFGNAAQVDPDLARTFAAQLPPGKAADNAQFAIIAAEAQQDAPKAAAAIANLAEGPEQQRGVEAVGTAWARADPVAAASWLLQTPEGSGKSNVARNIAFTWSARDVEATGKWVSQIPRGPTYDAAAGAFAWRASMTDSPAAMEWVASIGDPKTREQTARQVLDGWIRRDADSAKAWLQNTNLIGEDLRSYMLRR